MVAATVAALAPFPSQKWEQMKPQRPNSGTSFAALLAGIALIAAISSALYLLLDSGISAPKPLLPWPPAGQLFADARPMPHTDHSAAKAPRRTAGLRGIAHRRHA